MLSSWRVLSLWLLVASSIAGAQPALVKRLADSCRFADALDALRTVSSKAWGEDDLALVRVRLLIQLGRFSEAKQQADAVASRATANEVKAEAYFLEGLSIASAGNAGEASAKLRQAEALGFDRVLVEGARGLGELSGGNQGDAERYLVSALSMDATLTGALYNLACLRSVQGRVAEGAALLRQAWHLGWRNLDRLKSDPALENVRRSKGLIDDLTASKAPPSCTTW